MHQCACGRAYTAPQWAALPLVGRARYAAAELEINGVVVAASASGERHELRNCAACGSTRTRAWCLACGAEIPTDAAGCGCAS